MESHVPHCGTIVGSNRVRELKAPAWKKHANIIRKNDSIHAKMAPPVQFQPKMVASNVELDVNRTASANCIITTNPNVIPLNGSTPLRCQTVPDTKQAARHTQNVYVQLHNTKCQFLRPSLRKIIWFFPRLFIASNVIKMKSTHHEKHTLISKNIIADVMGFSNSSMRQYSYSKATPPVCQSSAS